ncbi:hypothetical protein KY312_02735 [Candidatus Woesearchaeota archaeon]|nr:hypothetical protein [Candidatus Woesearchaeota archaeon]
MNKKLMVIVFLTVLIISCMPGQRERGFGDREEAVGAFTGTKGVEIYLEQPQKIITFPGETVEFPIRVSNEGRFDTTVTLYVSGYDESLMQYSPKQQTATLKGKKSAGADQVIPGETEIVYFRTNQVELFGTSKIPQNTVVTACFPYETELTYGVCVDRNANGRCDLTAQPENIALSSGQGAPIAITNIAGVARGPSAGKTRVTYSIMFSQVDNTNNPKIVKEDKLGDACQGKKLNQYTDFGVINIDEIRLGKDIALECPAISGGRPLNIQTTTLTCYAEIPYENSDYISGLSIRASYGFMKSVTQQIEIQALT